MPGGSCTRRRPRDTRDAKGQACGSRAAKAAPTGVGSAERQSACWQTASTEPRISGDRMPPGSTTCCKLVGLVDVACCTGSEVQQPYSPRFLRLSLESSSGGGIGCTGVSCERVEPSQALLGTEDPPGVSWDPGSAPRAPDRPASHGGCSFSPTITPDKSGWAISFARGEERTQASATSPLCKGDVPARTSECESASFRRGTRIGGQRGFLVGQE